MNETLEDLVGSVWPLIDPKDVSYLIARCNELRKKPISDYEIEDLRMMIGQNIGLNYLLPEALKVLSKDILAEGDFYEGDLLSSVLTVEREYWQENTSIWKEVLQLVEANYEVLEERLEKSLFDKMYSEIMVFKKHL